MVKETTQNKTNKQNNFKQYQSDKIEQGDVKRMTGMRWWGGVGRGNCEVQKSHTEENEFKLQSEKRGRQ